MFNVQYLHVQVDFRVTHNTRHTHSQHVHQLSYRVALLHNDLLSPVNQCSIGILHSYGNHRSENVQSLSDNGAGLKSMSLQQTEGRNLASVTAYSVHLHTCWYVVA